MPCREKSLNLQSDKVHARWEWVHAIALKFHLFKKNVCIGLCRYIIIIIYLSPKISFNQTQQPKRNTMRCPGGERSSHRGTKKKGQALLADMIRLGILVPGHGVFEIRCSKTAKSGQESTVRLDLLEDGRIRSCQSGMERVFPSARACLLHHRRNYYPSFKYIHYVKGSCSLDRCHVRYLEMMESRENTMIGVDEDAEEDASCDEVRTPGSQVQDLGVCMKETVELEEYDFNLGTWSQYAKPRSGTTIVKKEEEMGALGHDEGMYGGHMVRQQNDQGYVSEEETVNCFQSSLPSRMMEVDGEKQCVGLDLDVSREEVIRRIETMFHFVINCLVKEEALPVFEIDANPSRRAFRMDSEKSLLRFARLNNILNHVHKHLVSMEGAEHRFTQRDLYYSCKVKDPDLKSTQLAELIQDASQLLRVPRYGLGIDCSAKGLVSGPMFLYQGSEELEIDCSHFTRGYQISGSVAELLKSRVVLQDGACCIVIVEKESVFQRLVSIARDQAVLRSCIFVTARGYPDIATRVLLNVVKRAAPCLPMVGLVDWNPHGLNILCQYRYGSVKSLESQCFALGAHLKWLGMRMNTMREIFSDSGEDCFRDLSPKDRSLAASIRGSLKGLSEERWISEIECMEYAGVKADIESIYSKMSLSSFGDLLGRMILKQDWV